MRFAALLFAIALAGSPAAALVAHGQDAPAQDQSASSPSDSAVIVVEGELEPPPRNSPLPPGGLKTGRLLLGEGARFVRCTHDIEPALLRPIVEGHFADRKTHDALDWVIRTHSACYSSYAAYPSRPTPYYGACNPVPISRDHTICRSSYDRAALVEAALAKYAPHFMLARTDTLNEEVAARFHAREAVRGKFRTPTDRSYYLSVSCMVQLEPGIATQLIHAAPGGDREARLRQQFLNKTRYCIGKARSVLVDPVQFRGYVADALYHWTLAAKNVETLIPAH
jgi:hypothetical protein